MRGLLRGLETVQAGSLDSQPNLCYTILMWEGSFIQKRKLSANSVSFDPENVSPDALDSMDATQIIGVMSVAGLASAQTQVYRIECTYQQYLDWEATGFDTSVFKKIFKTQSNGDWGWPWGRSRPVGAFDSRSGPVFYTI